MTSDLSLLLLHTLASERLNIALTACDSGVASPVEYAFVAVFFPNGDAFEIPKKQARGVRQIILKWKAHAPTLSRRFSNALKSLPARIEQSRPEVGRGNVSRKYRTIVRVQKSERSRASAATVSTGKSRRKTSRPKAP